MKKISMFSIVLVWIALSSANSLAYLDPGSGVAIMGSIWPVVVAFFSTVLAFLVKIFWTPIKKFFLKLKGPKK